MNFAPQTTSCDCQLRRCKSEIVKLPRDEFPHQETRTSKTQNTSSHPAHRITKKPRHRTRDKEKQSAKTTTSEEHAAKQKKNTKQAQNKARGEQTYIPKYGPMDSKHEPMQHQQKKERLMQHTQFAQYSNDCGAQRALKLLRLSHNVTFGTRAQLSNLWCSPVQAYCLHGTGRRFIELHWHQIDALIELGKTNETSLVDLTKSNIDSVGIERCVYNHALANDLAL